MHVSFYVAEDRSGDIINEEHICAGEDLYIPPIGEMIRFDLIPEAAAKLAKQDKNIFKFTVWKIITLVFNGRTHLGQHIYVYLKPWSNK